MKCPDCKAEIHECWRHDCGQKPGVRSVAFTMPGNPIPKARPRFAEGHVYTPPKTAREEERLRAYARKAGLREPLEGAIEVDLRFFRGDERRVDGDNLAKLVLDALNRGIAWEDDSQIAILSIRKAVDAENPRTEFLAREIR